ncbi:acetyl-CoA hydrolase [Nadsonia fulvescens var. elongata DSM 6958]|uniref:Acetyl-CoA hydrolase n=1 Tax=Nadsonia fulvescens var. elongata DSM 6958 TaxID=857566 RepID=A0A1E3PT54_9ASCO|nr:acetyl-CoA hydrolase [Nadsonia fulvescens var. elongata DSM 6958]
MSSMTASATLKSRVRFAPYLQKLHSPEECVKYFKNNDYVGWSGFTGVGGPKVVPNALAAYVEANNLKGKMGFNLFVGASADVNVESKWADLNMLKRRAPHQVGKPIAKAINEGRTQFFDKHLSMFPQDLTYGYYTLNKATDTLDTVIIEATAITEDGHLIPGPAVGATPELVSMADKIIIEVNTLLPNCEGIHDINMPINPPFRQPYQLTNPSQRIGLPYVTLDPSKVVAIVESQQADAVGKNTPADDMSKSIANNLIEFLEQEVKAGRMPENLHPLQSGIGNIANAVVEGLASSNFKNLSVWTEVLQDSFLDFFESGKLDHATSTSMRLTPEGFERFHKNWEEYSSKLLLRSQVVSNSPEIIRRLGVIAMNTPVEVDIYAHANSTNVNGSRMLNGLGGSADFLRNAKLSVMHTPSTRPTKTDPHGITCIVPFATHVDQTEHDLDVVVTEQGLADLRGLAPRERARVIIDKCAHPIYKPILLEYLERAEFYCTKNKSLHEPHILRDAFKLQANLEDKGTMRIDSW